MTELTHITQCDDPKYLPFARARIKMMRATGLKYASQKFEVEGVQINVRIEGEHSFVSIGGGGGWYSVYPTSKEHPNGITQKTSNIGEVVAITAFAVARPDGTTQPHKKYVTGRYDWVSYDGTKEDGTVKYGKSLITFDGDTTGRYPQVFDTSAVPWIELTNVVINGQPVAFIQRISGVALFKAKNESTGITTTYFIFASISGFPGANSTAIEFYKVPMSDATNPYAAVKVGGAIVAGVMRQPLFFDGGGKKCVSYTTGTLGDIETRVVRGVVSTDGDGGISVEVTSSVFPSHRDATPPVTSPHDPPLWGVGAGDGVLYTVTVSSAGVIRLLGIDLTAEGVESTVRSDTSMWSISKTLDVHFTRTYSADGENGTRYYVGDRHMFTVGRIDHSDLYYSSSPGDFEREADTYLRGLFYDVDSRYSAAVWVTFKGSAEEKYTYGSGLQAKTSEADLTLHAVFDGDEQSKLIESTPGGPASSLSVATQSMMVNMDWFAQDIFRVGPQTKLFASRNNHSYMLCATIPTARTPGYESVFAGMDLEPIVMQKTPPHGAAGKPIDHEKLGVAEDTAVWHFPITLIHSLNAAKA